MKRTGALLLVLFIFFSSVTEGRDDGGHPFFSQFSEPIFVARYMSWDHFEKAKATSWPFRYKEWKAPSPRAIKAQDARLKRFFGNSSIDLIQFDPAEPNHLRNLEKNYLPFSERPFCIMLENAFSRDYLKSPDGTIDFSLPFNQVVFYGQADFVYNKLVLKYPERYLHFSENGQAKPCLYLWNTEILRGDVASVLAHLKSRYGFFIIGGEYLYNPPGVIGDQKYNRLLGLDAVAPYSAYDGKGPYREMVKRADENLRKWRTFLNFYFPKKLLFAPFTPAFDDRRWRNGNTPVVPEEMGEVVLHAENDRHLWDDGLVSGILVILDEPFEGMAVGRNNRHLRPFLQKTALLSLLKEYFLGRAP